ncbi:MAG: hypothetical protein ACP5IA_13330, partial [Sediminispirochaetaceae bacterium]
HYRIASRHQGANTLAWQIILAARESLSSCINDIEKLEDYRKRGFSCATIQQWIPFEGAAGSDRSRE